MKFLQHFRWLNRVNHNVTTRNDSVFDAGLDNPAMNLPELDDIDTAVLLSTFTCKKKSFKVFFHKNQIVWDRVKAPFAQTRVSIEDVISVRHTVKWGGYCDHEEVEINPNSFIIHYATLESNNCLKYANVVFSHTDPMQVQSWVKTLQNFLKKIARPKNILMFVNPFGGRRQGIKINQKICKPLFEIAGVEVTVIVSQRKNQIRDYILEHCMDHFDAVACVGGDGTVSEIFNGLVMRECRDQCIDIDDANVDLPTPKMPIGIIPGGSTDTISYCLHGTTDITTAVLYIILGQRLGMDLVSVYDHHKLLRLYASVLSYGYLGDVIYHSEKYRWMGPRRYDYSGFKTIIANKGYEGEIAIKAMDDAPASPIKCVADCKECGDRGDNSGKQPEEAWRSVQGKFFMISGANISCSCDRTPNGIAPFCHLGNGQLHMVVVRHTSLLNNLRLLLRLTDRSRGLGEFPFVEVHQGSEFCFRPLNATSKWNCDGELQNETEIRAKVRCQLLTVFGRGRPDQEPVVRRCGVCC